MRSDALKNRDRIYEVAKAAIADGGAQTSLREIARRANVGLGTLYRHFPNREALLEALLRDHFDGLRFRAAELADSGDTAGAVVEWLRDAVAVAHAYNGAIAAMVNAIEEPGSALYASCKGMKDGGRTLLARAHAAGTIRPDFVGDDLFAALSALAWLRDQPAFAGRYDIIFAVLADGMRTTGRPAVIREEL